MAISKKIILIALGLSAMLLAACGARQHSYSDKHPEKAYKFVSHRVDSVLDDVDADDRQRDEVHAIKDRVYEDFKGLRSNAKKSRMDAFAELKKDNPDPKKLHALVDERMDEMRDVMHNAADALIDLHGVLDKQQRAELVEMIEERMDASPEEG